MLHAILRPSFRWLGVLVALSCWLVSLWLPAQASTPRHYSDLTFPPLPELRVPAYDRFRLANGLTVYLVEDHELPLVSGSTLVRVGSRWEPLAQTGLAAVTGEALREGGTTQHPAAVLDRLLEERGASIESSIGTTSGAVSFNALSENFAAVLGWFGEVIQSPAFEPAKLDLIKTQIRGNIARRNDDPGSIASREFSKLIYGSTSPYARTVEYETLGKISREDAIAFYERYVRPENMILGVVGDFDRAKARQAIEAVFGSWSGAAKPREPLPPLPEVAQSTVGGLFAIDRPQLTQSTILLGHLGGRVDSADYPALTVTNDVLNGFGGRLFNELRSRQGLAYSVYGVWDAEYDYPGTFIAGGQTRTEATVPLIQGLFSEIDRLRREPIEPRELTFAKESALNSFIFNFADPGQVLSRLMTYEYYGYPADFLFRYQQGVKETTIEQVQRVARTYLDPAKAVVVVVGNQSAMKPPLTEIAPVRAIDVTIPADPFAAKS